MPDLVWICCPKCAEVVNLQRLNKPLTITIKRKAGTALGQQGNVLHTILEPRVRCGHCGTIFNNLGPTMRESFGDDGVGDISY